MGGVRRRLAIGIFASIEDVEAVIGRLGALGIAGCDYFELPGDLDAAGLAPGDAALLSAGHLALRVQLETPADEQSVARLLLESPALSVQLHDVNPPAAGRHRDHE